MAVDNEGIGRKIRERRKSLGIKQYELAEHVGISNNHMSCIERGMENMSLEVLVCICKELRVTPDLLLMGSMHSNNVSSNLTDLLRNCDREQLELIKEFTEMLLRQNKK